MQHNRRSEAPRLTRHTWSTQQGVRVAARLPLLPHPSSAAAQHLSIKSWPGFREEGAACIHGLTMIKTHSEEPFKSPVPTMESLIGAYSARKVFFRQGKKVLVKQQSLCLLPCACKIYATLYLLQPFPTLLAVFFPFSLKSVTGE